MSETAESKHYESDPEIVEQFMEIFNSKSFPTNVKFQFIGSTKQKELIKIKKIADDYAFLLNEKELMVTINEDVYHAMDSEGDDITTILFETAIESISIKIDTGKITLKKPPIQTYASIVNKYGVDKIGRANQVTDLLDEQKSDSLEVN